MCVGILASLVVGLPFGENPSWWQKMFSILIVCDVLMALGMVFQPESHHWLFKQGKISEVESAIKTLYGKGKGEEVMSKSRASSTSSVVDIGRFDLFGKRYWKVVSGSADIVKPFKSTMTDHHSKGI
eukprot:Gb_39089 [translate_table: standard]